MEQTLTTEDLSLLEKFKVEALRFRDAYNRLMAVESDVAEHPELQAEFEDLAGEGGYILETMEYITRTVDSVTGFFSEAWGNVSSFFKNAFGLNAVPPPRQLGVVPIIGAAAIAGAIAMMGKWIRDVYLLERKIQEKRRLEDQGYSGKEAAQIVQDLAEDSLVGNLAQIAMPVGIAATAWFVYQALKPGRS